MMEATKPTPSFVTDLGSRALRLLAMGAIAFALEAFLDAYRLAALLMGAFAIEFWAGKFGLRLDETGERKALQSLSMAAVGFGLGASVVAVLVGLAVVFGLAKVSLGAPTLVGLGLGLLMPLAQAARDELLFRGAPLALMKGRISDRYGLPFVALLGGAPMLLQSGVSVVGGATVVVSGWIFALAWRYGRGMYLALGAHAGWLFMLGAGTRGSILDVSLGTGQWLPFVHAEGAVAWLGLGVVVAVAVAASFRYYRMG